jgi:4-amino-4-deoxy-L-arabinose transferase-like glycosyltransferase
LLAFALRVLGLNYQSLWRDEVDAIRFASQSLVDLLQTFASPGENGPLFYLLLRPWLDQAGRSEFGLRFFSVVCGVLAIPLLYRVAERLFGSRSWVALLASLLAATSPYLVWYSQEGKMYALVVVLVLLSMDRFFAAMDRGGGLRWLAYVLVTTSAYYVHLMAALILPVQVAIFFLYDRQKRSARWHPALASLAALSVPYLPLLAWQLPLLLRPTDSGYRFVPLKDMLVSLWTSYSFGIVKPFGIWSGALLIAVAVLMLLFKADRRARPAAILVLLAWLAIPVLGLYLITLVRPMYTARYLIFVVPAYLLVLTGGLVAALQRSLVVGALLLGGLLVLHGEALYQQGTTLIKTDFRAATQYVLKAADPSDLILFQIPYGRYSFEYYAQHGAQGSASTRPVSGPAVDTGSRRALLPLLMGGGDLAQRLIEGLYTNWGMTPSEVDKRMVDAVSDGGVVWLVETESALWDERGLVKDWLDRKAVQTSVVEFTRVSVYRYELLWP